ncbi:hypothetical protein QCA50_005962 [Cerrena zonata]|uniref:Uncharacterized protein n=1 Tax=Cerrena zonata TaxID=2478898 RepID=A0AAW0GI09_9APHY
MMLRSLRCTSSQRGRVGSSRRPKNWLKNGVTGGASMSFWFGSLESKPETKQSGTTKNLQVGVFLKCFYSSYSEQWKRCISVDHQDTPGPSGAARTKG